MPRVKIDYVISVSSEDPNHPASNLLASEVSKRRWLCGPGAGEGAVLLQLQRAVTICDVHIGAHQAAFVEVLVGTADRPVDQYEVLVPRCVFAGPAESRRAGPGGAAGDRVRSFSAEQLAEGARGRRWDRVRLLCSQPYNKHCQFGISFIHIYEPEVVTTESSEAAETATCSSSSAPTPRDTLLSLGNYSSDEDEFRPGTLFAKYRQNVMQNDDAARSCNTDAQIRKASAQAMKNIADADTSLKKTPIERSSCKRQRDTRTTAPRRSAPDHAGGRSAPDQAGGRSAPDQAGRRSAPDHAGGTNAPDQAGGRSAPVHAGGRSAPDQAGGRSAPDQAGGRSAPDQAGGRSAPVHAGRSAPDQAGGRSAPDQAGGRSAPGHAGGRSAPDQAGGRSAPDQAGGRSAPGHAGGRSAPDHAGVHKPGSSRRLANGPGRSDAGGGGGGGSGVALRGVVFAMSGFQNPERAALRAAGLALGARYRPDWTADCTHLVCAFSNTPKMKKVLASSPHAHVVGGDWLRACQRSARRQPELSYALRPRRPTPPPPPPPVDDTELGEHTDDTDDEIEKVRARSKRPRLDTGTPPPPPPLPSATPSSPSDNDVSFVCDERFKGSVTLTDDSDSATEEDAAEEEAGEGPPHSPLPPFLEGLRFVVVGGEGEGCDARLLARYVRAYGGLLLQDSELEQGAAVDYVVMAGGAGGAACAVGAGGAVRVRGDWLWRCHRERALAPTRAYELPS